MSQRTELVGGDGRGWWPWGHPLAPRPPSMQCRAHTDAPTLAGRLCSARLTQELPRSCLPTHTTSGDGARPHTVDSDPPTQAPRTCACTHTFTLVLRFPRSLLLRSKCVCMSVCLSASVRARARQRQRDRDRGTDRDGDGDRDEREGVYSLPVSWTRFSPWRAGAVCASI